MTNNNSDNDNLFNACNFNFCDYEDDVFYEECEYEQKRVKCGNQEGYECVKCKGFYPFAEINCSNRTFKCWECRNI